MSLLLSNRTNVKLYSTYFILNKVSWTIRKRLRITANHFFDFRCFILGIAIIKIRSRWATTTLMILYLYYLASIWKLDLLLLIISIHEIVMLSYKHQFIIGLFNGQNFKNHILCVSHKLISTEFQKIWFIAVHFLTLLSTTAFLNVYYIRLFVIPWWGYSCLFIVLAHWSLLWFNLRFSIGYF